MNDTATSTVLVIDDDPHPRRLLRGILENHGFRIAQAGSGLEAIAEAVRSVADPVLLNLSLPDMDGLTVLRRRGEWSQAPVC